MLPRSEVDSRTRLSLGALFGIPAALAPDDARDQLVGLRRLFEAQISGLASARKYPSPKGKASSLIFSTSGDRPPDRDQLLLDLDLLRAWFDPTAKGARVREAVTLIPSITAELPFDHALLLTDAGHGRRIVTPEGRALISCLGPALEEYGTLGTAHGHTDDDSWIRLRDDDVGECASILLATYRTWSRRRLDDVVGLLTSETSTLRPAAAGLLLTLLINRNTDPLRALPRPKEPRQLQLISEAIAGPAAAYATALTESDKTGNRSLDLYRGWPLGELRRRMGMSLHSGLGSGIYIEPEAVDDAISRLVTDIKRRPVTHRARVPAALDATLDTYERLRPQLAGLGLAFENPAQTRRLLDTLRQAAHDDGADDVRSAASSSDISDMLPEPEDG